MLDLRHTLSAIDLYRPVTRLTYTAESIARAHAEMLAEMAADDTDAGDEGS